MIMMMVSDSRLLFSDTAAQNNNIIIITRTRPSFREHLVVFPFRGGGGSVMVEIAVVMMEVVV